MYKLKNSGIVPRPSRIGNTFIGTSTDLSKYGYYTVTGQKPATEIGQDYVDSGDGVYDEENMTYTPDWQLIEIPVPEPVYAPLTKLQFLRLCKDFAGATNETIINARKDPDLEYLWFVFDVAEGIEREDQEIIDSLTALEMKGYITDKQAALDNWPAR